MVSEFLFEIRFQQIRLLLREFEKMSENNGGEGDRGARLERNSQKESLKTAVVIVELVSFG